jgi:hypothetical protein
MTFPIAIAFHGIEPSDDLRTDVLERARCLERFVDDILACRVVIEATSRKMHASRHYGVYIRLAMPCIEIDAGGKPILDPRRVDPFLTVSDTFDVLTCRLENYVEQRCKSCNRYESTGR